MSSEEDWLFQDSWWYDRDDLVEPFEWDEHEIATRIYGAFDTGKIDNAERQTLLDELFFGDTFWRHHQTIDSHAEVGQPSKYVINYVNRENYEAGHRIAKDTWYEPHKRPEDYAWDRREV